MDAQPNPAPSHRPPWLAMIVGSLALVATAAVLLALRHATTAPPRPPELESLGDSAPPVGRPAPDFSLPTFAGGTLSLHSLKGKPVVLNFWASWCAPCREETPMLVRLHKVYGPRGVAFVGIDAEDQTTDARRFIAQYHVDYPLVRIEDEHLIDAYAVPGLPTTVFIGADGIVMGKVVGGFVGPQGEKLLTARLDRLLAGGRP
jgi:cytochrome c biogenesis protein CcmG, thiol:disulfide interchange protein DsbE